MANACIEAHGIVKHFGRQEVLKGIDLTVEAGEAVGLVGNNGSGKSVLLKCLCGLMRPDQGEVRINGKGLGTDIQRAPEIGAVIEAPGFLPSKNAYDNLYALWVLNRRVPKENIARSIQTVGLDPKSRKRVGKYSMGMRQRLGLAQALMEDPSILLLDEPFNGLDKTGLKEMYALIQGLGQRGATMIVASHNPGDIEQLCAKVYEIDAGRMERVR